MVKYSIKKVKDLLWPSFSDRRLEKQYRSFYMAKTRNRCTRISGWAMFLIFLSILMSFGLYFIGVDGLYSFENGVISIYSLIPPIAEILLCRIPQLFWLRGVFAIIGFKIATAYFSIVLYGTDFISPFCLHFLMINFLYGIRVCYNWLICGLAHFIGTMSYVMIMFYTQSPNEHDSSSEDASLLPEYKLFTYPIMIMVIGCITAYWEERERRDRFHLADKERRVKVYWQRLLQNVPDGILLSSEDGIEFANYELMKILDLDPSNSHYRQALWGVISPNISSQTDLHPQPPKLSREISERLKCLTQESGILHREVNLLEFIEKKRSQPQESATGMTEMRHRDSNRSSNTASIIPQRLEPTNVFKICKEEGGRIKEHLHIEVKTTRVEYNNKKCMMVSLKDQTSFKALEKEKLHRKFQNLLITSLSHELRTPLHVISGMLELIEPLAQDPQAKEFCKKAVISSKLLYFMIKGILDYSQSQMGGINLINEYFDIRQLIAQFSVIVDEQLLEKEIIYTYNISSLVPQLINADKNRLLQVIGTLLLNSCKYTMNGSISFELGVTFDHEWLEMVISDTGIGISQEVQKEMFTIFFRVSSSVYVEQNTTRKKFSKIHQGMGMGFTLVRELLEAMGGGIEVDSEVGRGSKFTFYIKLYNEHSQRAELEPLGLAFGGPTNSASFITETPFSFMAQSERRETILEGDEIMGAPTEEEKVEEGNIIIIPESICGGSLMSQAEELSPTNTQAIPTLEPRHASLISMASSEFIHPNNEPLERDTILAVLPPQKIVEEEKKCECPQILVVDDQAFNIYVLRNLLKTLQLQSHSAVNGIDAIQKVQEANARNCCQGYKFIFMDCNMPEMDGYQATEELRTKMRNEELKHCYIIALTAFASDECNEAAISSGMDAVLHKPLGLDELKATLIKYNVINN